MSDSNRVQLAAVREVTPGTTPNTPRMRGMRFMGESLTFVPLFEDSAEIRSDRMSADPIKVGEQNNGGTDIELHWPVDNSILSQAYCSVFQNDWVNAPSFDNDGTADSVITDAGTTTDTYVVTSGGAAVKAGHLVRATGFTNSANNQIFRAASSTGTTVVGSSLSLTAETAPPAAARLKVVGFQGAAADITATSTGLASTLLDFTTLGLAVGQWIKVGGTAAGDKFATAALNDWIRITVVAAHAITCDNLPSGWTTDAGTGKTVKVWFGDQIRNGTTKIALTLERGYLDQTVPTYIAQRGMHANTLQHTIESRKKITGSFSWTGMGGAQSTTALDASIDAAPDPATYPILAASANVGRIAEAGSTLTGPNFVKSLNFTINNNLREQDRADSTSLAGIGAGECEVSGTFSTYFGDNSLLTKFFANTASNLNARATKGSQAVVWSFPRVTYNGQGSPSASAKNQDVMLPLAWKASKDSTTSAHVLLDRFEYFEA